MSCPFKTLGSLSRRGFLKGAGGLLAAAGVGFGASRTLDALHATGEEKSLTAPFEGPVQGGILTPQQKHSYFAAFDCTAKDKAELTALFKDWTEAARLLTAPPTAGHADLAGGAPYDNGDAVGLGTARLTFTLGLGGSLFGGEAQDRFGLAKHRPKALVDLPRFNGDQLVAAHSDGDISLQACADDPQIVFHAVRQMARVAGDRARMRWGQTGFHSHPEGTETPRNLMGFKDGTQNPAPKNVEDMERYVWVGEEGPAWLRGGSYLVARRIRVALEHWDASDTALQEQVIGRQKANGAPLGQAQEFETINLDAVDKDGNFLIPESAHIRLAAPASNGGAQILRRGYSYNDGINFTSERWPPWRQGMEYDAGLFFLCYQRSPQDGFVKIFTPMAKLDALNQFTTHTASGLFACPPGIGRGEYWAQKLMEAT